MITSLKPNEIFVFGSNLAGMHIGGAARFAKENFGAEDGVGEGLTGRCYAFPTLGKRFEKRGWYSLTLARRRFLNTAKKYPEKTFLLTKVGCGIAGYSEDSIKALFRRVPQNVVLPEGWSRYWTETDYARRKQSRCK